MSKIKLKQKAKSYVGSEVEGTVCHTRGGVTAGAWNNAGQITSSVRVYREMDAYVQHASSSLFNLGFQSI